MEAGPARIILNADDLGMAPETNRGIAECAGAGAVTSFSLMANLPGFEDACARLRGGLPGSLGVHLNFTLGEPLLKGADARALAGRGSRFPGLATAALRLAAGGRALMEALEREARAQIERVLGAGAGRVWHLDVHHHLHGFPALLEVLIRLAREFQIPALRNPREDLLPGSVPSWKALLLRTLAREAPGRIAAAGLRRPDAFYATGLTRGRDFIRALQAALESAGPGVTEIALHPGYAVPSFDSYQARREEEMRALRCDEIRAALASPRLRLIGFRELAGEVRAG